jgi:hypothetical protein
MKKLILLALLAASNSAYARQEKSYYKIVTGLNALQDQHINQYDDSENPPQAFDITLPAGHTLVAADVESGGVSVCSVTRFDQRKQRLTIEALTIETDAGTCTVTLTIYSSKGRKELKTRYSIEQTGT